VSRKGEKPLPSLGKGERRESRGEKESGRRKSAFIAVSRKRLK